jgi:hypothetical protein
MRQEPTEKAKVLSKSGTEDYMVSPIEVNYVIVLLGSLRLDRENEQKHQEVEILTDDFR